MPNKRGTNRRPNLRAETKKLSHQINSTTTKLIRSGKGIINSVPAHNFQLKIQRVIRQNARVTAQLTITVEDFRAQVRKELGLVPATTGTGEMFFLHELKVYASVSTDADYQLVTFDTEEATTADHNISGSYTSTADEAGVGLIHIAYPINNRPSMTASSPGTLKLITLDTSAGDIQYSIDYLVTYVRTPTSSISLMRHLQPNPVGDLVQN